MPLNLQDDIGLFSENPKVGLIDDVGLFEPKKDKSTLDVSKIGLPMFGGLQADVAKDLASRTVGVALGIANAPLAFVWGSQIEQYKDPKEWSKLAEWQKPLVATGAGFESARESVFDKGKWGTLYGDYYKEVAGKSIQDDLPKKLKWAAPSLEMIANIVTDPLIVGGMATKVSSLKVPKNWQGIIPKKVVDQINSLVKLENKEKQAVLKVLLKAKKNRRDYIKWWEIKAKEIEANRQRYPDLLKPEQDKVYGGKRPATATELGVKKSELPISPEPPIKHIADVRKEKWQKQVENAQARLIEKQKNKGKPLTLKEQHQVIESEAPELIRQFGIEPKPKMGSELSEQIRQSKLLGKTKTTGIKQPVAKIKIESFKKSKELQSKDIPSANLREHQQKKALEKINSFRKKRGLKPLNPKQEINWKKNVVFGKEKPPTKISEKQKAGTSVADKLQDISYDGYSKDFGFNWTIQKGIGKRGSFTTRSLKLEDVKAARDKIRSGFRGIAEITHDIKILTKGGERGSVSFDNLPPAQKAARQRLLKDFDAIKVEAQEAGKTVSEWLTSQGASPELIRWAISNAGKTQKIKGGVTPLVKDIPAMYERARKESKKVKGLSWDKVKRATVRGVVDVSGNLERKLIKDFKDDGRKVLVQHNLMRGSAAEAKRQVDAAVTKVYRGLGRQEQKLLDEFIQSTRNIEVSAYRPHVKHAEGYTAKQHAQYLTESFQDEIAKRLKISSEKAKAIHSQIKERAELYFKETENQLTQLYENGLIDGNLYHELKKHKYQPRQFLQHIDPNSYNYTATGKKITVPDSGIRALDEGSYGLMEIDSQSLLQEVISRTQSRIFKNNANKKLYELAKNNPDNGLVKIAKIVRKTEKGKFIFQKAPSGYDKISVMINGKPQEMLLPKDIAREWVSNDPVLNHATGEIIGWLSGSKILKASATGYNPGFALTNIPRDIGLIYQSTTQYSPHLPVYLAQLSRDLIKVAPDAIMRKGRWVDYIKQGGGMDFLAQQGQIAKNIGNKKLRLLHEVLSYVNNTSEAITRLALRERALRNGKSPLEATWEARNYLDFAKGGNMAKALDTGLPYLNAGIQATRGLLRGARNNPALFTYKAANIMGIAGGLYVSNHFINKECWDSIDDRIKEANFIITTPFYDIDANGKKRYYYIKIAKDQGQRVMASVMEGLLQKFYEGKYPTEQTMMAAKDFVSFMPTDKLPPLWDALFGYKNNKNFWTNRDIWKRTHKQIEPKEEWTYNTHPFFVKTGEKTGLSPERLKYSLSKFFTYTNPYVGLVGGGFKIMAGNLDDDLKEKSMKELFRQFPGMRRVWSKTPYYTEKERREVQEMQMITTTRQFKQTREFDHLMDSFYSNKTPETSKKVVAFLATLSPQDKKRLMNRMKRWNKIKDVPNRGWWLDLAESNPEDRATLFWNKWRQSSNKDKAILIQYAEQIPGINSKRFRVRLKILQNKEER